MSKTPVELRAQAKKLQDQAKGLNEQATLLEQKRAFRIGQEVIKAAENDFKGFTIENLKELVKTE